MKTVNKLNYLYKKLQNKANQLKIETIEISQEEYDSLYKNDNDENNDNDDPIIDPNNQQTNDEIIVSNKTRGKDSIFMVGDIMAFDKSLNKLTFRTYETYDRSDNNLQPIAVCVIPDNMLTDTIARWIYIDNLNVNGKDKFAWDKTCIYDNGYVSEHGYCVPLYGERLNIAACYPIINANDSYEVSNEIKSWETLGVMCIDDGVFRNSHFINSSESDPESLIDPGSHYLISHVNIANPQGQTSNNHVNMIDSPYVMELDYYSINNRCLAPANSSVALSNNAFNISQGIRNTYQMATCEHKEDYEAAYYVQQFETPKFYTIDDKYSGSWYIPSSFEASCIIARINTINASLVKCGGTPIAYNTYSDSGSEPESTNNGELLYNKYWTSIEATKNNANLFEGFWYNKNTEGHKIGGQFGYGYKYWELLVRPMCMTYYNANYNDIENVIFRWNNDSQEFAFVTIYDIFVDIANIKLNLNRS